MKLYRIIPEGFRECVTEDVLYKLGYISISKHHRYFIIQTDPLMCAPNPLYKGEQGIFFFKNPWDAVQCSWWVNVPYYSNNIVRVCEFDFPDTIIKKSIQGEGYYRGVEVEEVKIPLSVLETTGTFETELSPELAEQLKAAKKEMYIEDAELYGSLEKETKKNYMLERINNEEEYDKINGYNVQCLEKFMKCPFITGNMFIVTSKNRDWINIDHEYLVNNSCGVLTYENSNGWIPEKEIPKKNNL